MARKFKAFVERDKPKKRGARQHKKNKSKHEKRQQKNMATCLRGKRHAEREYSESVSYKCIKSKAEIELYQGRKYIKALILD